MIIVLKPDSTEEQVGHIVDRIHQLGLKTDVSCFGLRGRLLGEGKARGNESGRGN